MDAFVNARVPAEIKDQGNAVLKELGSTPTQLVNAAYRYLLAKGELPDAGPEPFSGTRVIDGQMAAELQSFMSRTSFDVPESVWESDSYDDILEAGRSQDYESVCNEMDWGDAISPGVIDSARGKLGEDVRDDGDGGVS